MTAQEIPALLQPGREYTVSDMAMLCGLPVKEMPMIVGLLVKRGEIVQVDARDAVRIYRVADGTRHAPKPVRRLTAVPPEDRRASA